MKRPKTQIYKPMGSERHELCHPVDHDDFETITVLINGARGLSAVVFAAWSLRRSGA